MTSRHLSTRTGEWRLGLTETVASHREVAALAEMVAGRGAFRISAPHEATRPGRRPGLHSLRSQLTSTGLSRDTGGHARRPVSGSADGPLSDGQPCPDPHRELSVVHWRDRLYAATAQQLQRGELPPPGGLPGATEAFPGEVRSVLVGDRPVPGNLPPHRMAVGKWEGPAQLPARKALVELADGMGLGHLFTG